MRELTGSVAWRTGDGDTLEMFFTPSPDMPRAAFGADDAGKVLVIGEGEGEVTVCVDTVPGGGRSVARRLSACRVACSAQAARAAAATSHAVRGTRLSTRRGIARRNAAQHTHGLPWLHR